MSQYSSPKIWGPHFWFILRCVAHNYPLNPTPEEAAHVKSFFYELQYVLPCEICKYTFKQHYNKHPIEAGLLNRGKLIDWVETIFEETKRVIQDKRVKIMDIFDEPEINGPIRIIYKPKKIEKDINLEQIRKSVISQETKPVTNLTPQIKKEPETAKGNKIYKLTDNDQNFDIKNKGRNDNIKNLRKKNDNHIGKKNTEQVNKITPKNQAMAIQYNPPTHNTQQNIHNIQSKLSENKNEPSPPPQNHNIVNQIKHIGQSNNYHQINKPSNKQFNNIRSRSILNNQHVNPEPQKTQRQQLPPKQAPYIPPSSKKPIMKELVITRKCKKCHQ